MDEGTILLVHRGLGRPSQVEQPSAAPPLSSGLTFQSMFSSHSKRLLLTSDARVCLFVRRTETIIVTIGSCLLNELQRSVMNGGPTHIGVHWPCQYPQALAETSRCSCCWIVGGVPDLVAQTEEIPADSWGWWPALSMLYVMSRKLRDPTATHEAM